MRISDWSSDVCSSDLDNRQFRLLKQLTPGPYTFILEATKTLPKRIAHEKRKTIGIRVPEHVVAQALLETISEPLISCTLQFPGEEEPVSSPDDYRALLDHSVDIVIDGGPCGRSAENTSELQSL